MSTKPQQRLGLTGKQGSGQAQSGHRVREAAMAPRPLITFPLPGFEACQRLDFSRIFFSLLFSDLCLVNMFMCMCIMCTVYVCVHECVDMCCVRVWSCKCDSKLGRPPVLPSGGRFQSSCLSLHTCNVCANFMTKHIHMCSWVLGCLFW